jgi:hypothetical protein
MYELEQYGIELPSERRRRLAQERQQGEVIDNTGWRPLDTGIVWGKTLTIYDKDGLEILKVTIELTPEIKSLLDQGEGHRVLVKLYPDGTVKTLLIDFERKVPAQSF